MRLKKHRDDVKYLSNGEWIYPQYAKIIAKRYLNLLRFVEPMIKRGYAMRTEQEKRVLKDAEK